LATTRNVDLAEESAVRAVAMDAVAGARPDVAAYIEPEAVEESRIAGRKDLATRERAAIQATAKRRIWRDRPSRGLRRCRHVEELFIG